MVIVVNAGFKQIAAIYIRSFSTLSGWVFAHDLPLTGVHVHVIEFSGVVNQGKYNISLKQHYVAGHVVHCNALAGSIALPVVAGQNQIRVKAGKIRLSPEVPGSHVRAVNLRFAYGIEY